MPKLVHLDKTISGGGNSDLKFIGTQAEWDALPQAEKDKYIGKELIITDDYESTIKNTVADCVASENPNDIAGASALSELNDKVKEIPNHIKSSIVDCVASSDPTDIAGASSLSEIVRNIGEFKSVSSHGAVGNNQDYTVDISQYKYDTVGNFLIISTNWSANPETIFTLVNYSAGSYFHVVDLARKGCVSVSGNVITIKNTSRYVVYRL